MRGKTLLLNKSVSLSARKLEAKSSITSEKEQAILTRGKSWGNHPPKYALARKRRTRMSQKCSAFNSVLTLLKEKTGTMGFIHLGTCG